MIKNVEIIGWNVPLLYFMISTLVWAVGMGPFIIKEQIPWMGFLFRFDIALQAFTRFLITFPFCIYYANIVKIHIFTQDSELQQSHWKFEFFKHEMNIDETTFQFDLIQRGGSSEITQIPGCKMLPHLKKRDGKETFLWRLGVFVPMLFMVYYYFKPGFNDKECN